LKEKEIASIFMRYEKKAAEMDNIMREEMLRGEQRERDGERCSLYYDHCSNRFSTLWPKLKAVTVTHRLGLRRAPVGKVICNQLHLEISSTVNHCIWAVNRERRA